MNLNSWIEEFTQLTKPDHIHICTGSQEEYDSLCQLLVEKGVMVPLKRPGSFWCHSDPADVARVEERTFICSRDEKDAGPTNNWHDPEEMKKTLKGLFAGCMKGRTAYVIPFSMGPIGSPLSLIGVQITDSPYVVCNMRIMTRMGQEVLDVLGDDGEFIPCHHSVGVPLEPGQKDVAWPCRPDDKYIVHYPEERSIWSFGSGYGGNSLLGKKCLALRIASVKARDEGWLAEHMLIVGVTNPQGVKKFFAAAFPSACGKTNMAMMNATLPGWKVECVGDDIAWMRFKEDGRLHAINPEAGFFGVAPGTSNESNPNAMKTIEKNSLFTNTALTDDKDVWWEGMTKKPPARATDWKGHSWTPESGEKASHPNARFTTPTAQCPVADPAMDDPNGVPISGIIFGGRRDSVIPLVLESLSWDQGTFFGAALSSQRTAAAAGKIGELRHDPFAMLPFCGYHMADYFGHWLDMGQKTTPDKLPKIFYVNWFKKDDEGHFLWPGFGENSRVLKWCFERCEGTANATETSVGYLPKEIDTNGLDLSDDALGKLLHIETDEWKAEVDEIETYFKIFGDRLPAGIRKQLTELKTKLETSSPTG